MYTKSIAFEKLTYMDTEGKKLRNLMKNHISSLSLDDALSCPLRPTSTPNSILRVYPNPEPNSDPQVVSPTQSQPLVPLPVPSP